MSEKHINYSIPELINGIDIKTSITRTGGIANYARLLVEFAKKHENSANRCTDLLQDVKFDELKILVHSIKGVAGTLGITDLHSCAAELESTISKDRESICLIDFSSKLNIAIKTIKSNVSYTYIERELLDTTIDVTKNIEVIDKLIEDLSKHRFIKDNTIDDLFKFIRPYSDEEEFIGLIDMIKKLKFKDAHKVALGIKAKMTKEDIENQH